MRVTRLSSTELKRRTAEVLNLVAYGEVMAIIERYGEPLVKITPIPSPKIEIDWEKKLRRYFGIIPNFPEISKARYFRRRNLKL